MPIVYIVLLLNKALLFSEKKPKKGVITPKMLDCLRLREALRLTIFVSGPKMIMNLK